MQQVESRILASEENEYMNDVNTIKIGTRGSALALAQTELVIKEINKTFPDVICEKVIIHTTGDKILNKSLVDFGGKGVFVTEFEDALVSKKIDLAVHSSKDMPTEIAEGLIVAGVLPREDARDVLVTLKDNNILNRECAIIGTGSLRRQFQMNELYSNVKCRNLRGNVTTRLDKLKEGIYDGIILAAAGLRRLQLDDDEMFDYRYFEYDEMIPAGGQGIIAVEGRKNDKISDMVFLISNETAFIELETERMVLKLLDAGCHEAIGVVSTLKNKEISIKIAKEKDNKVVKVEGITQVGERIKLVENLISQLREGVD